MPGSVPSGTSCIKPLHFEDVTVEYIAGKQNTRKGFLPETIRNCLYTRRLAMDTKAPAELPIMVAPIVNFQYFCWV